MRTLRRGDRGAGVAAAQHSLVKEGFLRTLSAAELGHFGPLTESAVIHFQQTHMGPGKTALDVTGRIDAATRWAFDHASGEEQRQHIDGRIPDGMTPKRQRLLELGLELHALNVHEQPNGSNRGPLVDPCFPPYLLPKPPPGEPWCCFWGHYLCYRAHGEYPLGVRLGSCYRAHVLAKAKGVWRADPTPGDLGVMLHRDEAGKLTLRGHLVVVLRVGVPGDNRINSLEGNCGNRFALGLRRTSTFAGFINWYPTDEQPRDYERGVIEASSVAREATR